MGQCDRKAGVIRKAKTKNNEAVAIPMNAAVSAVLDKLEERRNGSPYVFPHIEGEHAGEAIKDVKSSFRTALKESKIERYAHLSPRYLADKVKLLEKTTLPNSCQMQDATRGNSEQDAANRSKK